MKATRRLYATTLRFGEPVIIIIFILITSQEALFDCESVLSVCLYLQSHRLKKQTYKLFAMTGSKESNRIQSRVHTYRNDTHRQRFTKAYWKHLLRLGTMAQPQSSVLRRCV